MKAIRKQSEVKRIIISTVSWNTFHVSVTSGLRSFSPKELLFRVFPICDWLFLNYKWRSDLLADIIAGLTVAIMHIPQGEKDKQKFMKKSRVALIQEWPTDCWQTVPPSSAFMSPSFPCLSTASWAHLITTPWVFKTRNTF